MNSDSKVAQKLPDGWILCQSKSIAGRKYYFNKKTGKSSWTQPQAEDVPVKNEQNKPKAKKRSQIQEKKKKEIQKKSLKRSFNGIGDNFFNKKQKQDTPVPDNVCEPKSSQKESPAKSYEARKFSPQKKDNVKKKESPIKPTPTKNLANNRLSHLRSQLNLEAQLTNSEDTEKSLSKKHKISPKPQRETILSKLELKSPNLNETKCSTSQSPSSDSLQSIPSPSQFFAANKIIYSMKSQLPEEYCNKMKPKDTFADIEEGICNQMAEYPFMKHPATPPQFSEASKLVSAIKSRLSYKATPIDMNLITFESAKDRLEALRTRLSSEAMETMTDEDFLSRIELPKYPNEAMEVEDYKEVKQSSFQSAKENVDNNDNLVLVVDTNIFIHELSVIKTVLNSHIKGYSEQPTLLVPWRVINELDRLKDNNNGNGAICKRARSAMDYLYKSLPENNRIKGQSLRDANSHIYPCELPDDEILNCCLQQAERGKSVILLSNDKNLCNKAVTNRVKCIGLEDLKILLESKPQPSADPDLYPGVKHYENTMYHLLANILENEMRAKYNNLWQHVLFKAPPWSLADVLQCLLKHWVAVFNEVFPRIEHLIKELKNTLVSINKKDPKSLSQSEVSNFKELCLDIAKKCQIIPEYMELAKATVERLLRKCETETGNKRGAEMVIIDAFEGLWTIFSSYCAKLSTAMGIQHSIEDKLRSNEPLHVLTGKWPLFSNQVYALTHAMQRALDNTESLDEPIAVLEAVFKESLTLICMDSTAINHDNMRIFCTKCRNMLQEAFTKFAELSDLLNACKNNMGN